MPAIDQTSPAQKPTHGLLYLRETNIVTSGPGNEDQVPARCYMRLLEPDRLPDQTLDSIANYRFSYPLPYGETEATVIQTVGQSTQHQQMISVGSPFLSYPLKLLALDHPLFALHGVVVTSKSGTDRKGKLLLPVGCNRQTFPSLAPSGPNNSAPTRSSHPNAETMSATALTLLGLISSFGHDPFLLSQIIFIIPCVTGLVKSLLGTGFNQFSFEDDFLTILWYNTYVV